MDCVISRSQIRDLVREGLIQFKFEDILEKHYKNWIKSGDCVVDIGAHNGRPTDEFQKLVGRNGSVLAFEPIPTKFDNLETKYSNTNVSVLNVALSDQSGMAEYFVAEGALEESGLKQRVYNKPENVHPKKIFVTLKRLDEFEKQLQGLRFVKIDIEGAEINCLRGAVKTLSRFRPLVSVEYGASSYAVYGNTSWSLFDFCEAHGYILYDIFLNRLSTRSKWGAAVDTICWDYFMVPAEKESEFIEAVPHSGMPRETPPYPLIFEDSLSKKSNSSFTLVKGFATQEEWGVWTDGPEAVARIEFREPLRGDVILGIRAHGFVPRKEHSLTVSVFAGHLNLGQANFKFQNLDPKEVDLYYSIPHTAVHDQSVDIRFVINEPRAPADFGLSSDSRKLGVGISRIFLYEKTTSRSISST